MMLLVDYYTAIIPLTHLELVACKPCALVDLHAYASPWCVWHNVAGHVRGDALQR